MNDLTEAGIKRERVAAFLQRHRLDGMLLTERANFSWITCGKYNYIANNATAGVASILATADQLICLANTIEAPRMRKEELEGTGIDTVSFAWWDRRAAQTTLSTVMDGRVIATDGEDFGLGLPRLPADFAELRWSLTEQEIARYRECGRRASIAMEAACRSVQPGETEHEIAGRLAGHIHAAGLNPLVTLVAADERIASFRHPIPTDHRLSNRVMLVTCADYHGLIACLTRFVSFRPVSEEIRAKHRAVCQIEAAVIEATRPGRTLGEVFTDLRDAYADAGHADQWQLHHQGGSTGYANREAVATPGDTTRVRPDQAFAWNPSITGAKSEDTVLITEAGFETLTPMSDTWPRLEVKASQFAPAHRPDILVR